MESSFCILQKLVFLVFTASMHPQCRYGKDVHGLTPIPPLRATTTTICFTLHQSYPIFALPAPSPNNSRRTSSRLLSHTPKPRPLLCVRCRSIKARSIQFLITRVSAACVCTRFLFLASACRIQSRPSPSVRLSVVLHGNLTFYETGFLALQWWWGKRNSNQMFGELKLLTRPLIRRESDPDSC